ncbi:unnamed protein product [Ilex paraguariensis]|uniref:Uncharacterized protein n=1 Tax=Ilex paraguariensis TaxID=185542 RepID=A0ABC8SQA5_9AQUA
MVYSGSQQTVKTAPPCHKVFKYLVPMLIALLAIKCQAKGVDPFETSLINMWCCCIAICIYYLAMGIRNHIQTRTIKYSRILNHVMLIFGTISSVSLLSVIFPHFPRQLILVVPAFLPIILAQNKLKHGWHWLYNQVIHILDVWNWVPERNVTEQEPNLSPPVQ